MDSRALRLFALCALTAALVTPLPASGAGVRVAAVGPSISGNVYDAGGAPLPGITVKLYTKQIDDTWLHSATTTSLANGAYAFLNLIMNKTYAVQFVDSGGTYVSEFYDGLAGATVEDATHIFIPAGGSDVFDVDAYMGRAGGISGTVRNSLGEAVPTITVNAYRYFGGGSFATTITASGVSKADGTYVLGGLGGGSYAVQFNQSSSPYATHFYSTDPTSGAVSKANATPVAVSVSATTTGIDATMLSWAGLEGTVRGAGGEAVNAALVELYRWEGGTWSKQGDSANTTVSGGYALPHHLYPGTYRVSISGAAGYPAQYHQSALLIAYATDVPIAETATASLDTTLLASDATAPVSTTTPLPSEWVSHTVTATLTAADEPGGSGLGAIYWTLDSATPTTYTAPVAIVPEGEHDFRFWAVDRFTNVEAEHTATVRIDKSAPFTEPATSDAWRSGGVTFSVTASDALSGVQQTLLGVGGETPSAYPSEGVWVDGEGVTTLEFLSIDNAGNREVSRYANVRIDNTPPTTTASGFVDDAWRNTTASVTLVPDTLGGSDIKRTWYSVDGAIASSGTAFTVDGEGVHIIEWGSVDALDNAEATRSATIRIDLAPPVTTANAYGGTGAFTLSPSDAGGSGLAGTWYSLDGGGWTAGTSISAASGSHSVRFYSTDNAGNSETPVGPVAFTVAGDTPPPADPPPVVTPTLPKATLTRPYAGAYTVYRYRSVPVYGFLKPRHAAGATSVTLQAYHYENGRWVRRATWLAKNVNYSSYTKYVRSSIAFKYKGRWRVRAYHSDSRHAPSYSSWSYFTVR